MVATVTGKNAVEAWKAGAALVLSAPEHRVRNLVTEIRNPTQLDDDWLRDFDPKSVGSTDRLSVVAKVLFPLKPKKKTETREEFYDRWNNALTRNKKLKRLQAPWGTYFGRLTRFGGTINQLENIVSALSTWGSKPEAALVAHISSPALDSLKPIGSPCLQYIEVLQNRSNEIELVAVYRNHDFLKKALGNFIGLGRLLQFIASESGKKPTKLTCHSVRAYTDEVGRLRKLL